MEDMKKRAGKIMAAIAVIAAVIGAVVYKAKH